MKTQNGMNTAYNDDVISAKKFQYETSFFYFFCCAPTTTTIKWY